METPTSADVKRLLEQLQVVVRDRAKEKDYGSLLVFETRTLCIKARNEYTDQSLQKVNVLVKSKRRWWGYDYTSVFRYDFDYGAIVDAIVDGKKIDEVEHTTRFRRGSWEREVEEVYLDCMQKRAERKAMNFLPVD
jgi:hypothetical protein